MEEEEADEREQDEGGRQHQGVEAPMRDARDHVRGRQARAIEEEHEGDRDIGRDLHRQLERRRRRGEARQHDGCDQEQGERVGGEAGESLTHDGGNMPQLALIRNGVLRGFSYHVA